AGAFVALADPRSGRDADLTGPTRLPAGHQPSPPLACCQAPTNPPSRRAPPRRSRMARGHRTPRRWGLPDTVWVRTRHPRRGDLCWIVSVGGCGSQAGRSALGRCARGEAQPLGPTQLAAVVLGEKVPWTWRGNAV